MQPIKYSNRTYSFLRESMTSNNLEMARVLLDDAVTTLDSRRSLLEHTTNAFVSVEMSLYLASRLGRQRVECLSLALRAFSPSFADMLAQVYVGTKCAPALWLLASTRSEIDSFW